MKDIQVSIFGLLILMCACNVGPPLRVITTEAGVEIDVSTLGEYPTTISGLRISNADTEEVLLELESKGEILQIWSIGLKVGENHLPVQMEPPDVLYDVIVPSDLDSFFLEPGVSYRVEVWGSDPSAQSEVVFEMGLSGGDPQGE